MWHLDAIGEIARLNSEIAARDAALAACQARIAGLLEGLRLATNFARAMHELVDHTNPNCPIGIALTEAGFAVKPEAP